MKISIISPVYMAASLVDQLVQRNIEEVSKITEDYEIILVEDGGKDNSWEKILQNCSKYKQVKGIKLSRNFGQHYAITAGISKATGDYIILMDYDLQDDPVYIHKLIEEVKKGNDIVFTTRSERKHNAIKRFNSWLYNRLFKLFSNDNYDIQVGSLVIFSNRVSKAFLSLKEKDRLYIQFLKWVGYKSSTIKVEHRERPSGTSSYNFVKLISLGIQGWTSHSNKLLKLSTYMGFSLSLISFLLGVMVLIKYLLFKLQPGWPSLIIALLFSTGLILMSIGVAGIYIGKIFEQVKNRPLFIIEEELNLHER